MGVGWYQAGKKGLLVRWWEWLAVGEANLFIKHSFGLFVYTADGRQTLKMLWFSGKPWISRKVSLIYWKLSSSTFCWVGENRSNIAYAHVSSCPATGELRGLLWGARNTFFLVGRIHHLYTPWVQWKGKSRFGFRRTQWSYNNLGWKRSLWRAVKWGFWQAYVPQSLGEAWHIP